MGNSLKNRRRQAQIREYAEPRGLYEQCAWDRRFIRREILTGKLAPCFPGVEGGSSHDSVTLTEKDKSGFGDLEECPICLLFYPGGLNRMLCCKQSMCTECYLQVKLPPQNITPTTRSRCPFCKSDKFDHAYTGPLSAEQKKALEIEQQKVLELQIKMRSEERKTDLERQQQRAKAALDGTLTDDGKKTSDDKKEQPLRAQSFSLSSTPDVESEPADIDPDVGLANEDAGLGVGNLGGGEYDMTDIEQLMLEEALRRSLLDSKAANEVQTGNGAQGGTVPIHFTESTDIKHVPVAESAVHEVPSSSALDDEDEAPEEEGEDLTQAILLSLELLSSSGAASSSSSVASLP